MSHERKEAIRALSNPLDDHRAVGLIADDDLDEASELANGLDVEAACHERRAIGRRGLGDGLLGRVEEVDVRRHSPTTEELVGRHAARHVRLTPRDPAVG